MNTAMAQAHPSNAGGGFRLDPFHPAFQRLLELEARASELLQYRSQSLPYWCLVRVALLGRLLDRVHGGDAVREVYLKPRPVRAARALSYVAASLIRSPFRYSRREVVFFSSGTNWMRKEGAYFNTRSDYFARQLEGRSFLLIEGADDLAYARPRAVGPVAARGGLTVPASLYGRLMRPGPAETRRVRAFMSLLSNAFAGVLDREDLALLETYLIRAIGRSKVYQAAARRLLDRLAPRVVFVESAHTGFDAEFLVAAREMGATTVEYQHGAINPYCPYHNFNPTLLAHGYSRCLPDHFLSYGDHWNEFLTTSARITSIGNPHVDAMRSQLAALQATPGSIYFLSSAGEPSPCMQRMREMLANGFRVVFRPHPVERAVLGRLYGTFFADTGIDLDLQHDFFGQLRKHEFVVGDGRSTSLFEAYAIAGGRVRVLEMGGGLPQALPNHDIIPVVSSVAALRASGAGSVDDERRIDALFAPDWQARFSRFLAQVLP